MDHKNLESLYSGLGASSYDLVMMEKVIVYAYVQKIYSSRQIAKAVREYIYFIWQDGISQIFEQSIDSEQKKCRVNWNKFLWK